MNLIQELRDFWSVGTLEQAMHERVTVPAQPHLWNDEEQAVDCERLLAGLAIGPGMTVLDYGCGVGRMARQVVRRGCRVVAVDVSPAMLDYCRAYCGDSAAIEYVLCDGDGIPAVADASIDGAYSFFVFQHMPRRTLAAAVLADLHRVLRPGGWCRIQSVDTRTNEPVARVGFHGERQTGPFLLEQARAAGFRRIVLEQEAMPDLDNLVVTSFK